MKQIMYLPAASEGANDNSACAIEYKNLYLSLFKLYL